MTKNYIEYRVYLKDGADTMDVNEAASSLQDIIIDTISEDGAPKVFTQDVTYEIRWEPVE